MVSLWVGLLSHFWALRDDQQSECHIMHIKWKLMNFCVYSSIQIDDASFTFDFIQLLSRYAFFCHPVDYATHMMALLIVRSNNLVQSIVCSWNSMNTYRVLQNIVPPLHSKTGQWHTLNLYIFMIPHQFQINMQDFRSPTWFAYFRWHVFWVRVELLFANKFCLNFWGNVRKIATKCSIIDVDPYMIPHFEANMTHYVFP